MFDESQKLSVLNGYNIWRQICGFEWKCTFFSTSSTVHTMLSSILLDYLRHEHVIVLGGALSSHLWQMQNQIRLGWVSPAPFAPPGLEMKWRILLCSKGLRMFSVSVRRVGLTTSWKVLLRVTKTVLYNNLRQALEMTEEHVIKWRIHSAVTSNKVGYFTLYHYFRI